MFSLVLKAFWRLIYFDVYLTRENFGALHAKVHSYPIQDMPWDLAAIVQISSAVDTACIWYFRHALCLQRSAATICLMRDRGIPAQLVLGSLLVPFRAHAWVEVEGRVVNDKPYMREIYAVIDRC